MSTARHVVAGRAELGPEDRGRTSGGSADVLARLPEERVCGLYDLWPKLVGEPMQTARPCSRCTRGDRPHGRGARLAGVAGARGAPPCLVAGRGRAVEAGRALARDRPHHRLAALDRMALLKIAVRLNAAAEQNRPNIKPLNILGRFCATKAGSLRRGTGTARPLTDSPPGMAAAGFCMLEPPLPVKPPVHRPPGCGARRR